MEKWIHKYYCKIHERIKKQSYYLKIKMKIIKFK